MVFFPIIKTTLLCGAPILTNSGNKLSSTVQDVSAQAANAEIKFKRNDMHYNCDPLYQYHKRDGIVLPVAS